MRSTVFRVIILLILVLPLKVSAYNVPELDGEEVFNRTAGDIGTGGFSLNPIHILNTIGEGLTKEIKESAGYIVTILFIAAMSGTVRVLSDSLKGSVSASASFVCFAMMSAMAINCFTTSLTYATGVINSVCTFITKLTPVFIMTLFACGDIVTGSAFSPILSASVYVISVVLEKCLVPMICFSAVLSVAGNINERVQVSNFCRVLKSSTKWIMVAVITIFTAISAAYGLSAPSLDNVSVKAVKFAVGSLVPVVGNFLSDTLETVLSGTRLIKNAVGVAGMVSLCAMCLIPILKIFTVQLIMKAGAAMCEPLADKRISTMLWDVSESIMSLFAVTVMIMVLFLINIGIILIVTGF